ncbi:hypothetical protein SAMN05444372_107183 [Flavobacterium micromati]|jgi:hypothetical protein|uniref:Uncharacterized protein n=1 Tax=Flavobacterium micromati TaxID=229205 RepID=A0A1M5L2A1_9FLAO|nr:hypothetical protein [Flavobacterium micromati]SHG59242.1 hypothetical protein SAMN05444372_107183 [Flavobacterium micromati]
MTLENLNLGELSAQEQLEIDGGGKSFWEKTVWGYAASQIIDNWEEVKSSWRQGWADGGNH